MGLIEIIITTFIVYGISLTTYLLWHGLLWEDESPVPLLKHFYYGEDSSSCEGTRGRRREKRPD